MGQACENFSCFLLLLLGYGERDQKKEKGIALPPGKYNKKVLQNYIYRWKLVLVKLNYDIRIILSACTKIFWVSVVESLADV